MQEGSILVGFSVEPYSGGRDLNEFADDITVKVGQCRSDAKENCHLYNNIDIDLQKVVTFFKG